MRTSALRGWIILSLLGVSAMLWAVLLLSRLHAINVFDAYLLKKAGPVVVFGAMLLCPLLAAMLGLDVLRRRQSPMVGRVASVGGTLLTAAFVILIGIPLVTHATAPATPKNPSTPREWGLVCRGWGRAGVAPQTYRATKPFAVPAVTKSPAADAFQVVLAGAGATLPQRDAVDTRVVAQVQAKTGKIIDSPAEVGGYPQLAHGTPPADSDHDGLPDEWETKRGLNPQDPADAHQDRDGDGYTNIQEYLHSKEKRP